MLCTFVHQILKNPYYETFKENWIHFNLWKHSYFSCGEKSQEYDAMSGATMKSKSNKSATEISDWWPNMLKS